MAGLPPIAGARLGLMTLGLGLGTFLVSLDFAIANVSIPNISGDLAVSPSQGTWVITSYMVFTAMVVPLTGPLKTACILWQMSLRNP